MAIRFSQVQKRRQKESQLSILIFICSIAGLVVFFLMILGFWWWMMPSSGAADDHSLTLNQQMNKLQIKSDVDHLANTIGQRNMHTPGTMSASVDFITTRFTSLGFSPEKHPYTLRRGIYSGRKATNVIAGIPGSAKPEEIIIVGAHYDTVPDSPGANDNASGVAVLLAVAGQIAGSAPDRTIRFAAFANEEPPFFHTRDMGSYAYAKECSDHKENIIAMIALDGLGYFDNTPGSQRYPLPGLGFIYSDRAEFIGLVTRLSDLGLLRKISNGFKESKSIPSETAALPAFLPGVNWSDHWSFWKHNYSAILITDTLLFRDPAYHTPGDTPDRLNYENMARMTTAFVNMIKKLDSD